MLINVHKLFTKFWDIQAKKKLYRCRECKKQNTARKGGVYFVLNTTN